MRFEIADLPLGHSTKSPDLCFFHPDLLWLTPLAVISNDAFFTLLRLLGPAIMEAFCRSWGEKTHDFRSGQCSFTHRVNWRHAVMKHWRTLPSPVSFWLLPRLLGISYPVKWIEMGQILTQISANTSKVQAPLPRGSSKSPDKRRKEEWKRALQEHLAATAAAGKNHD